MALKMPPDLVANCVKSGSRSAWLDRLPSTVSKIASRWSLTLLDPFDDATCAWVAPVMRADGTSAVLKLGMPHMEAEHESHGLRFWDGDPTARLFDCDDELGAILLERCAPGVTLRSLPEPEQDLVISSLLPRLWRQPANPHPFRPLSHMLQYWTEETLTEVEHWPDEGLVREGLSLFHDLSRPAPSDVLLATDLHAGNVLQSQREPWLVIDPKPFVGDATYDATQHLFNCDQRLRSDPKGTIRGVADLFGLDHERVRLWMFARAAAEPRDDWRDQFRLTLATAVSY
jgi:streptomycin 6-kinase